MHAQTRVSAKGQVVIPKEIRLRHQMSPGRILDVVETPEGVLLRAAGKKQGISKEEALGRIRKIVRYDGPPVSIDEINETIEQMWARGGPDGW
jgi:AbrB family looped-hinge helix DNA binding protein